jgi:hypothetical protein
MKEAITTGMVGFAAYLLLVLVLLRVLNRVAPSLVVTVSSFVAYVATLAAAVVFRSYVWFWPLSATYWFLALFFLMIFGAIYKSVSFRILLDLSQRPRRTDRYDSVLSRYVEQESYQNRLRVMVTAGLAVRRAADLELTPKGRRLAGAVARIQALYKIERSG